MLEQIRKGQRWLTGILVALVGGVFVFFMGLGGPLQSDTPSQGLVVELGNIRLAQVDFQRVRAQQAESYRQQLGDQFSSKTAASFLDAQALRALVDRAILAHDAHELGLRVGKTEIQRLIRNSPGFRDPDGKFDRERFEDFVEYEYGTQRNYVDYMRRVLLGQKMAQLLYTQGEVSESEARSSALYRLQQVRLAYVALDGETLPDEVELGSEEIEAYSEGHEAELRAAYEQRLDEFQTAGQAHMRHILFELGPSPSDPELDEAREKADAALARLAAGEPFEELASELSDDDATRDAGGDLGFLDPEEIASELADAAAALEPGGTSGVTRSERGLHLVMLVERVEPGPRPFEQVRSELATEGARRLAARKRADSQSDALVTAIRAGESLEDAARGLEIPIERTSLLRRRPDGFVAGLGSAPELLTTAFALTEENPTSPEIFPVGSKLALIQLLERSDPDEADLEETMQGERERLAAGKRDSFVQNWIDERRTQLINAGELLIDSSIIAGS